MLGTVTEEDKWPSRKNLLSRREDMTETDEQEIHVLYHEKSYFMMKAGRREEEEERGLRH